MLAVTIPKYQWQCHNRRRINILRKLPICRVSAFAGGIRHVILTKLDCSAQWLRNDSG